MNRELKVSSDIFQKMHLNNEPNITTANGFTKFFKRVFEKTSLFYIKQAHFNSRSEIQFGGGRERQSAHQRPL